MKRVLLLDTSAAVALLMKSHEQHVEVMRAVKNCALGLAGHSWFETYSVLTRLPAPARRPAAEIVQALQQNFPESVTLSQPATRNLARRIAELGITGGAVYDALVGAAAAEHSLPLLSLDKRAKSTYEAVAADHIFPER